MENFGHTTRRQTLAGLSMGTFALLGAGCGKQPLANPDLIDNFNQPPLIEGALVNRARCSEYMDTQSIDAIICSNPENIYYLTRFDPQLSKMGLQNLCYAILPRDAQSKPILVIGQFEFYLAAAERVDPKYVDVRLYSFPADPAELDSSASLDSQLSLKALPSILPTQHAFHKLSPSDRLKREKTLGLSKEMGVNSELSLIKTVRDLNLKHKNVAIDTADLKRVLDRTELDLSYIDGDQLLRRIRLQKTKNEIELARFAANANAQAGLAAAKYAVAGASSQEIRRLYFAECARRYLTPSFMVVDGIVAEQSKDKIEEGRSFLIDCVSSAMGYHGDYGRTVCVGDPSREIKKATKSISHVWDRLLPELRPGLKYSEIGLLATRLFKEMPSDAFLNCNPHSVGLHHTDEPSTPGSTFYSKENITLLEGMVLSVDLPIVDVGLGGSAHLEDLVLITKDGAELLNDGGDQVIIV